jgi:hypothetical protein
MGLTIFTVAAKVSPLFRSKRMERFLKEFKPDRNTRILDVGGYPRFWQGVEIEAPITLLNTHPISDYEMSFMTPNQEFVLGDGTALEYGDREFDLVFSNSVIEHLGTYEKQVAFAREIRRVGKSFWVQTPAREFVLEPHVFAPFVHWFPPRVQRRLLRYVSLWGWLRRPSPAVIDRVLAELRLLTRREVRTLFADARIWTERVVGLPKSYTAFKFS